MAEENPRQTRIILGSLGVIVIAFVYILYKGGQGGSTGTGGRARCIMHGMLYPKYDTHQKSSFSDMIRLHFDVKDPEDKEKCEGLIESYCYHNVVEQGYLPTKLTASWKPDREKTMETVYSFSETCKLARDEKN